MMNRLLQYSLAVAGAFCLLVSAGSSVRAQEAGGAPAAPAAPPVTITAADYVIAAEDVLEIQVLNQPPYSRTIQVNVDGTIDYPIVGQINVVGMKLVQLKQKLLTGLRKRFVNPSLTLAVRARAPKQVNLFGNLRSKGKQVIPRDDWKIRDVVAAAGGLDGGLGGPDRYEFYHAELLKARIGERIPIDLHKLFIENDESQNKQVEENDTFTVTIKELSEMQVQIIGQVGKPGPVIHPKNGSIVDVLQSAGGPTPLALLSEVTIERTDGTKEKVNMVGFKETGFDPKVKLRPGDKLIVPENKKQYKLLGRWIAGGTKIYPEDKKLTMFQVVADAGGSTDGAELKQTRVTRRLGTEKEKNDWLNEKDEKGKPYWVETKDAEGKPAYTRIVNVEKMLKSGDRTQDIEILPDDEIYVQASGRRRGFSVQEIWQTVGAITGIIVLLNRF